MFCISETRQWILIKFVLEGFILNLLGEFTFGTYPPNVNPEDG
jgi:hypothetical protein